MKTTGIYLSGTGNTKHCMERLLSLVDRHAKAIPMESPEAVEALRSHDRIFLGYPTQFSDVPMMVKDFIRKNKKLWKGKHVICIATMGAFSGDGAGCSARILKKCGAIIDGGIHLRMPDSVCDHKALKKTDDENAAIIRKTDTRIEKIAQGITNGKYPRNGLNIFSRIAGFCAQRLWWGKKTRTYSDELKIDSTKCIGCGICANVCPMHNIKLSDGKPIPNAACTMCYRCISLCPGKAITLLGKEVVEQCRFEKYQKKEI